MLFVYLYISSIQTPGEKDEVFEEDYFGEFYPDYQYDEDHATQDEILDFFTQDDTFNDTYQDETSDYTALDEAFDYTSYDYETTTQMEGKHVKITKIMDFI